MSVSAAQAAAAELRTALLDHGVRAVSLELQQGVAGSGWGVAPFKRGLGHHIVSRPPGTPGLALVKRGRSDLAGPLCNGYGGFDLVARIITMGWANHPGAGGPWSVPGWGTIPKDNGRPYIFGWEFEGGLVPYTDEMHDFMARCGAGTLDWLGTLPGNPGPAPLDCWGEHFTWAGPRKIDRLGYTTASGRQRIAAVRGTGIPQQEDDMFTPDYDRKLLEEAVMRLQSLTFPKPGKEHVPQYWWPVDPTAAVAAKEAAQRVEGELVGLRSTIQELVATIGKLAQGDDVDVDALVARIDQSLDAKLADHAKRIKVEVSVPSDDSQ